jgi:hypothetical protein
MPPAARPPKRYAATCRLGNRRRRLRSPRLACHPGGAVRHPGPRESRLRFFLTDVSGLCRYRRRDRLFDHSLVAASEVVLARTKRVGSPLPKRSRGCHHGDSPRYLSRLRKSRHFPYRSGVSLGIGRLLPLSVLRIGVECDQTSRPTSADGCGAAADKEARVRPCRSFAEALITMGARGDCGGVGRNTEPLHAMRIGWWRGSL